MENTNLDKLLKRCEFDMKYMNDLYEAKMGVGASGASLITSFGIFLAKAENARVMPIITALVNEVESLREALKCVASNGEGRGMGWTPAQHSRIARAESDKRMAELLGERE